MSQGRSLCGMCAGQHGVCSGTANSRIHLLFAYVVETTHPSRHSTKCVAEGICWVFGSRCYQLRASITCGRLVMEIANGIV